MKKILLISLFIALCAGYAVAARQFIEGTDYFSDFKQNEENMAAVLHINFISIMPAPAEAEVILKDQLKVYGNILKADRETAKKEKEKANKESAKEKAKKDREKKNREKKLTKEEKEILALLEPEEEEMFKNIIGSVWYTEDGNPENMEKVQYSETSSAFVWLGKTQRIVAFPDYIKFLKKEKENIKKNEKEKTLLIKQLQQQKATEATEELEEPQP